MRLQGPTIAEQILTLPAIASGKAFRSTTVAKLIRQNPDSVRRALNDLRRRDIVVTLPDGSWQLRGRHFIHKRRLANPVPDEAV